jgi:hypothetical protein
MITLVAGKKVYFITYLVERGKNGSWSCTLHLLCSACKEKSISLFLYHAHAYLSDMLLSQPQRLLTHKYLHQDLIGLYPRKGTA